jgi:Dynamin family
MPDEHASDLSEHLKRSRQDVERTTLDAISGLQGIARGLSLTDTEAVLGEDARSLTSETLKIIVLGRFKNGKSTLINALIGGTTRPVDLRGAEGPMVVDDLPATAVLSEVSYADTPFVRALKLDGQYEQWTLAQYLRDSGIGDDNEESRRRFAEIRQFEIGFPARLCQSGVVLYDSPGLEENVLRTRITLDAVQRSDAALMVFSTNALIGEGELSDDDLVRSDGTHVFVVVNLFGDRQADDRLRAYAWNRYVRDYRHGPTWTGQDPADYDIYFVNAKLAAEARYRLTGPAANRAYRDSGLATLEQRLTRFLIDERFRIHLATFTLRALYLSDGILQQISQRQAAVTTEQARLRAAWADVEPRVASLNSRAERAATITKRYQAEAVVVLPESFAAATRAIRRDLPTHLAAVTLATESARTFAIWHQRKLLQESVDEISSFIARRINDWSENEADPYLRALADRLGAEIGDEVAALGRLFDAMNMALTGWDSTAFGTQGNVHSTTERVTAAIAGILFGDLSAAVVGGKGGWRGAAGGILGAGAATWLLVGVLGITSGIVFLPILALAALTAAWMGSAGIVGRIKRKTLSDADEKLALLVPDVSAKIASDLETRFEALGKEVTEEISAFVDEQTRNLEAIVKVGQQEDSARELAWQELKKAEADVTRYREMLTNVLADSRQQ